MKIFNKLFLKGFYNFMLIGLPSATYNPFQKNSIFHTPATIDKTSTYINYKIPKSKFNEINKFIKKYDKDLSLIPTSISNDNKDYFISINIYNCSSPIFNSITKDKITRCEINTYIVNGKGEEGTLIIDYSSNFLSLDPINIFKKESETKFKKEKNVYNLKASNKNFKLRANFIKNEKIDESKFLNEKIIEHTDNIFYLNGIYDKLYYDSSLIKNKIKIPKRVMNIDFEFLGIKFEELDSIFYFEDQLNFVGAIWANLYDN